MGVCGCPWNSSRSKAPGGRRAALLFEAMENSSSSGPRPRPGKGPSPAAQPPYDLDIEQAVLGALLIDDGAIDRVSPLLREECFYIPLHQLIYSRILAVHGRMIEVDLVTINNELNDKEVDALCPDGRISAYLSDLSMKVASAAHVESHARILWELWARRRLVEMGHGLSRDAGDKCGNDVADVLDAQQDALSALVSSAPQLQFCKMVPLMNDILLSLNRRVARWAAGGGIEGVLTGHAVLDELLGGMQAGELHVLAARPSVGKTAFALGVAVAAARAPERWRTLFYSLEMSREQLGLRLLALLGGLEDANYGKIAKAKLTRAELTEIGDRAVAAGALPIEVDDTAAIRLSELCAKARAAAADGDGAVGLVIVDYLQLVTVPNVRGNVPREQVVGQITRTLKALAKELKAPVLALAQLNRGVETRAEKRPSLADLRESGSIEQDADTVMVLHAPERHGLRQYPDGSSTAGVVELHLLKNRKGQAGMVYFDFAGELMRFAEAPDQADRYCREPRACSGVGQHPPTRGDRMRIAELSCTPFVLPTYEEVMRAKEEAEARGEVENLPF